jgi:SPP1 gp7 family putative phage head morphogenesis protein
MAARGEEVRAWKVGKLGRLKDLQKQVAAEVNRYGQYADEEIRQGASRAIVQAQADAKALTQAALPGLQPLDVQIMARWQSLNPQAVESMLGFLDGAGPISSYLRKQFGAEVSGRVSEALLQNIALGYNPRKAVAAIREAMGSSLTDSLRLARTVQVNAYREGTRAAYVANQEIVPQWRWRSARDERTCASCIAMDGSLHPVTESLNDHWNGRCVATPVPITYRDLGFDIDEPPSVLKEQTGEDWFKAQPENVQKQMLGPGKFGAWKAGKFEFSQLSQEVSDPVWGTMRVETPLKNLVPAEAKAA